MIYAARQLVEGTFTLAAVNAQIAALNSAWTAHAADLALVADGAQVSADQAGTYPCLLHYVGVTEPTATETARTGKRDMPSLPVALGVYTRPAALADNRRDVEFALEALLPLIDSLRGQSLHTNWGCIDIRQPDVQVMPHIQDGALIRLDGIARFTMYMRRTGV